MIGVHMGDDDGVEPLVLGCELKFPYGTDTDVEQNRGVRGSYQVRAGGPAGTRNRRARADDGER